VGQPIIVVHEAETYSAEISQHSSNDGAMREAVLTGWKRCISQKGFIEAKSCNVEKLVCMASWRSKESMKNSLNYDCDD
jgi:hypothetical protein